MRIKKFNEISSYSEYGNSFDRESSIDMLSKFVIDEGDLGVYYDEMVSDLKDKLQSVNNDDLKMMVFTKYLDGEIKQGNVKNKTDIPEDFNIDHYRKAVKIYSRFQDEIAVKYTEKWLKDKYLPNYDENGTPKWK